MKCLPERRNINSANATHSQMIRFGGAYCLHRQGELPARQLSSDQKPLRSEPYKEETLICASSLSIAVIPL
jgi:hypothetical protein